MHSSIPKTGEGSVVKINSKINKIKFRVYRLEYFDNGPVLGIGVDKLNIMRCWSKLNGKSLDQGNYMVYLLISNNLELGVRADRVEREGEFIWIRVIIEA